MTMTEPSPRFWEIFFEVFENLPRQGPGNSDCARYRAAAGGYLAFSDAVWRKENPPAEVKDSFDLDYPAMGRVEDDLSLIRGSGFEVVGHFTLPDEAWWDDFYTPMEPEMHRRYSISRQPS